MFCQNCGKEMSDNAAFCSNCGWLKKSNVSKKGVLKIPKIPKGVLKSAIVVFGIVIIGLIIYNFSKPKGNVYEFKDISDENMPLAMINTPFWADDVPVDYMDSVKFGSYPQSDISGNRKDPIEWIVLDRQDDKVLLLSKYILDCKCYNNELKAVTWETCDLRKWLNNDFYNQAFNGSEQNKIQTTNVINSNNTEHGINGGNNTNDKVFCLSTDEVERYFYKSNMQNEDKRRATRGTKYAKNKDNMGKQLDVVIHKLDKWSSGNSRFWLRSPGENLGFASLVDYNGSLFGFGINVDSPYNGVRPALWVSFK